MTNNDGITKLYFPELSDAIWNFCFFPLIEINWLFQKSEIMSSLLVYVGHNKIFWDQHIKILVYVTIKPIKYFFRSLYHNKGNKKYCKKNYYRFFSIIDILCCKHFKLNFHFQAQKNGYDGPVIGVKVRYFIVENH